MHVCGGGVKLFLGGSFKCLGVTLIFFTSHRIKKKCDAFFGDRFFLMRHQRSKRASETNEVQIALHEFFPQPKEHRDP